ncbi:glycoside hydrolase family 97 catalytic domain-containing protein [Chitinophaga niabensis]|uniref:glycoside hydrolase family 97 protein n=1 Tax=Chitinophaga niabensis TaxID=536979 RepID=UPI0031BA59F5
MARFHVIHIIFCLLSLQANAQSLRLTDPSGNTSVSISANTYSVSVGKRMILEPSALNVKSGRISRQYITGNSRVYEIDSRLEFRLFKDGCAFRYKIPVATTIKKELTSFVIPAASRVWFFERNSDWKLKSYAGWWTSTPIDSLPIISPTGPIQGKPLVVQLADKSYMVITEAALYNYSGMRLEAIGNRTVQVNFTESSFDVQGGQYTPWRVILHAADLNSLVNNQIITALNPSPDKTLFKDVSYIQPGKAVWSWITRKDNYMQPEEEKRFIDAATTLQFNYTLLDDGWETAWANKWEQLKEICTYAAARKVKVWVWKDSKWLREPAQRDAFLDSVVLYGAVGIKTDFMNSEAKALVDFEIGFLQACAARKLMVNFHGCHAPTGESVTYPNEMTREGIRGMELNIMKEPIPAWHNAALPFTRFLVGHGDYTPGFFSNKGPTTYTHQLALMYLFNSPFQCMAENPVTIVNDPLYAPIIPLLQTLPVTWDETKVLPGSVIGELAAFAKRKGKVWYVAVINGTAQPKEFVLRPGFLERSSKAVIITDGREGFMQKNEKISPTTTKKFMIPATGGIVIQFSPL